MQGRRVSVTLSPSCEEFIGLLDVDTPNYVELILVSTPDDVSSGNGGVRYQRVRIYASNIRHIRDFNR